MPALPIRLRAFLGVGGVADFHRLERLVDSVSLADASGASDALLDLPRERPWGDDELRRFCALVSGRCEATLHQRPFHSQLITALALFTGHGVQLATGEGKTLAGAIAAIAFALTGRRVHVVSVNDYLARRDAEWMEPLFQACGVSVGWVSADQAPAARRRAHASQVCFVSAAELGFDVLRDRFRIDPAVGPLVEPDVAVIDEVDAVLIDEATTPLVLATERAAVAVDGSSRSLAEVIDTLVEGEHFEIDTDHLNVSLTDDGVSVLERELGVANLFDSLAHDYLTAANLALHARTLVHRDRDYIVRDGRLELVSTTRGRVALAQRWPDGLQEAVEAKERLVPSSTSDVLDSITTRALVSQFRTVCGMSGTALAVAPLLVESYGFTTGVVDSRVPSQRQDRPDRIFATVPGKLAALVRHVQTVHATGQPVLVGTANVADSERLADALTGVGITATVLNAKNDAEEATVIARAGEFGRVTVSTQMAGRGTDIRLGGVDERDRERVARLGGLHVVGFEHYRTGRLDEQLRGRAARQGDPGSTVFFASLDDDVVTTTVDLLSDEFTGTLDARDLERAGDLIRHAQRMGEVSQEQQRATTVRFGEIPARQRAAVLRLRAEVLNGDLFPQTGAPEDVRTSLISSASAGAIAQLTAEFGSAAVERYVSRAALFHLDDSWRAHAAMLAEAKEGIHLRSLARDNPLTEYIRIAQREFDGYVPDVRAALTATLEQALVHRDIATDPPSFVRPGSTWTYMVTDDPFGSPEKRLWRRASSSVRRLLR
jgi:preprotein translocase subunit SecA